ncbi:MAG: hypothetical protein ABIV63_19950 [Caldimonas sp.]
MESPQTDGMAGSGKTASAPGQAEISDAKSAGRQKDRIGWRLCLERGGAGNRYRIAGAQHRRHEQDLKDGGRRKREDLRRLHDLAGIGCVLMAQRRLEVIHAGARDTGGHHLSHRRQGRLRGTQVVRQCHLREQQCRHQEEDDLSSEESAS